MSEINHDAARDFANEVVEFYANNLLANGYRLSNAEQRDYLVSTAYLDLHAQLDAERARVEALCDVIYDANGIAYPFEEMQDKMTAILNGAESEGA